jgi:hypothetical protein
MARELIEVTLTKMMDVEDEKIPWERLDQKDYDIGSRLKHCKSIPTIRVLLRFDYCKTRNKG